MLQAVTTKSLTKHFGKTIAVDGIDLEVASGEVFGLLGPSGAGKTTLLQLLAALLDPTAGRAVVLGHDVVHHAEALRPRIGYVSQEFTLYGSLSIEENLNFFADLYGVPLAVRQRRKEALLSWSRLAWFRHRRAARLSGGMQKKLHLCCSLIHEPEILFLDEPTTGVDPVSRRELWENLYDLVGRGLTLIVATPYMDEAERCHRVALMQRGIFLRCESPERLKLGIEAAAWELRSPELPYVQEQLRRAALPVQLHRIGDHLRMVAPINMDIPAEVQHRLAPTVKIDLRRVPLSMQDVFVSTVTSTAEATRFHTHDETLASPSRDRPSSDEIVVQLQGLTRTFGDFVAVDGISLSVQRGEIFGFLGPNGSGKTTTIRMLCGLLSPSAGHGEVLGQDIRRQGRRLKSRLGYMSQRFSLYHDLTVSQNLAFFGRGYGLSGRRLAERVAWALAMADLNGAERRLVRELSGGVRQRLALGCALLHEPEILFLDEPTAGIDPLSRRAFWGLIDRLAARGVTVFVTTHYMDEAENCHRLGLIHRGRLIALGNTQTLRDEASAGVMLELESRDPFKVLGLLQAQPSLARASLFGNQVHVLVENPVTAEPLIRQTLKAADLTLAHVRRIPISLEDLFVILIETESQKRGEAHA